MIFAARFGRKTKVVLFVLAASIWNVTVVLRPKLFGRPDTEIYTGYLEVEEEKSMADGSHEWKIVEDVGGIENTILDDATTTQTVKGKEDVANDNNNNGGNNTKNLFSKKSQHDAIDNNRNFTAAILPNLLQIGGQKCGSTAFTTWLFQQNQKDNQHASSSSSSLVCGGQIFDNEPSWYDKEVHFFDTTSRWKQGRRFYSSRFEHCLDKYSHLLLLQNKEQQTVAVASTTTTTPSIPIPEPRLIIMDATPGTQMFPDRVATIFQPSSPSLSMNDISKYRDDNDNNNNNNEGFLDDHHGGTGDRLKIIFIVREPISRELSWYNHKKRESFLKNPPHYVHDVLHDDGITLKTFDEYVESVVIPDIEIYTKKKKNMVKNNRNNNNKHEQPLRPNRGLYAYYLKLWYKFFHPKQILVLSYDEMRVNPENFQRRVNQFLNTTFEETGRFEEANTQESKHKTKLPSCYIQEKLQALFGPENEGLYELLDDNSPIHGGPWMQQRPFPRFQLSNCLKQNHSSSNTAP